MFCILGEPAINVLYSVFWENLLCYVFRMAVMNLLCILDANYEYVILTNKEKGLLPRSGRNRPTPRIYWLCAARPPSPLSHAPHLRHPPPNLAPPSRDAQNCQPPTSRCSEHKPHPLVPNFLSIFPSSVVCWVDNDPHRNPTQIVAAVGRLRHQQCHLPTDSSFYGRRKPGSRALLEDMVMGGGGE